jgi:CheY-like chemotaxis protein
MMTSDGSKSRNGSVATENQRGQETIRTRALVVEDETLVAWHLEAVLQDLGFEVCDIVSTGRDAIRQVSALQPTLVFMDINLNGDMDGIEAAKEIRERSDVPIIFVTAYGNDKAIENKIASALGESVIVGKPATPSVIQGAIQRLRRV